MEIILIILAWTLGVYLGILATEHRWESNAFNWTILKCRGNLYKVVKVNNSQSWDYLKLHE